MSTKHKFEVASKRCICFTCNTDNNVVMSTDDLLELTDFCKKHGSKVLTFIYKSSGVDLKMYALSRDDARDAVREVLSNASLTFNEKELVGIIVHEISKVKSYSVDKMVKHFFKWKDLSTRSPKEIVAKINQIDEDYFRYPMVSNDTYREYIFKLFADTSKFTTDELKEVFLKINPLTMEVIWCVLMSYHTSLDLFKDLLPSLKDRCGTENFNLHMMILDEHNDIDFDELDEEKKRSRKAKINLIRNSEYSED
jgi:hypothetical protein